MNYKQFFKNKKITVMGLGLLGRGLGDVKFLAECGADLIVTDLKNATQLEPTLKQLESALGREKFTSIKYVLGEHRLEDFRGRDMILKNAGVPTDSPFVAEARKNGIPIEMDESLFAKLAPPGVILVGVTGTRGKTTVTTLIYEMLEHASEQARKKEAFSSQPAGQVSQVFLAGNIKGVATLPMLAEVKPGDILVLELSSWQLQGFGEAGISPHIAVFTNFLDDHLNYYKGSREEYFKDKSYIYKNQKEGDFLVVSKQVLELAGDGVKSKVIVPEELSKSFKINMPGEHNRINASFAYEVGKILNIEKGIIEEAIIGFKGVSGRLQFLKKINGIEVYDDTTSVSPDSLLVALESLGGKGGENNENKLVLIMGGADKNLDMEAVIKKIPKYTKAVILFPGTGTDRVKEEIKKYKSEVFKVIEIEASKNDGNKSGVEALGEAVTAAFSQAKAGDKIVFSPGFASFGMFVNEYDRGDKFNEIVSKLS